MTTKKRMLCRCLCRYAKRLGVGVALMGLSVFTPLFALTVGGTLSLIGNWYGNDKTHAPNAYVLLGGGLTQDNTHTPPIITLNAYSYKRTQTLWQAWQKNPLPVVVSGVEAAWIVDVLNYLGKKDQRTPPVVISENASMNTCENARFSTKLIKHLSQQGGLPTTAHAYLVSDWYHMARARRQFALSGLATTPLVAPLPTALSWTDYKANLNHSRRAFYEAIALLRDIVRPQKNCRHADNVSLKLINTPRKSSRL